MGRHERPMPLAFHLALQNHSLAPPAANRTERRDAAPRGRSASEWFPVPAPLDPMPPFSLLAAFPLCLGAPRAPAQDVAERALKDQQGTWPAERFVRDGQETPAEIVRTITRTIE